MMVFVFFLIPSVSAFSQIKFDFNLSDSHREKIEKTKDAKKKLKKYKKFNVKDSVNSRKQQWKDFKQEKKDSLKEAGQWKSVKQEKKQMLLEEWKKQKQEAKQRVKAKKEAIKQQIKEDSARAVGVVKDSLSSALQELEYLEDFETIRKAYEKYGHYDSAYLSQFKLDSTQMDSAMLAKRAAYLDEKFKAKEKIGGYMPEKLKGVSDAKIDQSMMNGEVDEYGNLKQLDQSGLKDFFANIAPDQFGLAQLSLKSAMVKYMEVPDLEKKDESGVKKNSLKGVPPAKRIFIGGNIGFPETSPLTLDGNIQVGYWISRKWLFGVGVLAREQLVKRDSTQELEDSHGFNFFTRYFLFKSIYGVFQYDRVIAIPLFNKVEDASRIIWQEAYLLGVGRDFDVGPALLNVAVLYDFNYQNNDYNAKPLVIKIGFQLTKDAKKLFQNK